MKLDSDRLVKAINLAISCLDEVSDISKSERSILTIFRVAGNAILDTQPR